MNNGFIFGFTESKSHPHNHQNILLIKTDANGNMVWSRRYDAGADTSLELTDILRTFDDEILISGEARRDKGVSSARCIIKLKKDGNPVWGKQYTSNDAFGFKGLVQLKDSSFVFPCRTKARNAGVIRINANGNVLSAVSITNKTSASIQSITAKGNSADIIVGMPGWVISDLNVANLNFQNHTVRGQREYKTSNQFTSLLSTRCKNGDIVFLAGRNSGGLLTGTSRVFRTNAKGSLLWAKNISAAFDKSGSLFSNFDIVSQVYVHEDINRNIVAVMEAESTATMMVVFDAAGNYLYHRLFVNAEDFFMEAKNGSYITASSSVYKPTDPLIANRFLCAGSACDSSIFVTITNGTDSAAILNPLKFSPVRIVPDNIAISVRDAAISQSVFCSQAVKEKAIAVNMIEISIIPNPAFDKIIVRTKDDLPFSVLNINGNLLLGSVTNHVTDISKLKPGYYMVAVKAKNTVIKRTFLKQ